MHELIEYITEYRLDYVRRLIESEQYELPVVSYQEITPEISVQPVSRVRL